MVVSIDWLSFSLKGIIEENINTKYFLQDFNTRIFKKVYVVKYKSIQIGVLCSSPHSKILPENFLTFKIENKLLYYSNGLEIIKEFFCENKLEIQKIARLDICCDFQMFNKKISPNKLINLFTSGKILKCNKSKFQLIGKGQKSENYEYFKIGSRSSNVCTYLYNKSLEMKEVREKAHIRELWTQANINNNIDVWRLEFSINTSKLEMLDLFSGELKYLNFENLFNKDYLISLYNSLIHKYFEFRYKGNDSNFNRLKKVELFENAEFEIIRFDKTDLKDSSRMNKFIVKKIDKIFSEYSYVIPLSEDIKVRFLLEYLGKHNLTKYYKEHQNEFDTDIYSQFKIC